jgi:hypothetical protein
MPRHALLSVAATLTLCATGAFAQTGDLGGVTLRVLDTVEDVDAVILALDTNRAEGEQGGDADGATQGAAAERGAAAEDAAGEAKRERPNEREALEEQRAERRERDVLHDTEVDERSEGRLEDRDVPERPVAAPTTP